MSNVASYNYVTDEGANVTISFYQTDEKANKSHGGYNCSVSVVVNGVTRLAVDDHFSTIGDTGLGEWMVGAVINCLKHHLESWFKFQMVYFYMTDRPPLIDHGLDSMPPIQESPLAARHIEQLDDESAFWWLTEAADFPDTPKGELGLPVFDYLSKVVSPRGIAAFEETAAGLAGLPLTGHH